MNVYEVFVVNLTHNWPHSCFYCFLEQQTKCQKVRELAKKLAKSEFGDLSIGAFVPSCEKDGSYSKTQCYKSTGFCWCVNANGEEIPGTKVKGSLNCDEGELPDYKFYFSINQYLNL